MAGRGRTKEAEPEFGGTIIHGGTNTIYNFYGAPPGELVPAKKSTFPQLQPETQRFQASREIVSLMPQLEPVFTGFGIFTPDPASFTYLGGPVAPKIAIKRLRENDLSLEQIAERTIDAVLTISGSSQDLPRSKRPELAAQLVIRLSEIEASPTGVPTGLRPLRRRQ